MSTASLADEPKTDTVSATELRAAFNANVLAAEKKYATGKPIRVSGTAGSVKKDGGGYFFTLGDTTCRLSKEGEKVAADLQPGRKVIVTGTLAVTVGGPQVGLELKGCTLEILPEEKKAEAKKDLKAPEPLEKPYTEYITVKVYSERLVPDGETKAKPGFFKPKENVHAHHSTGKDGVERFIIRAAGKSGSPNEVGPKTEITDKDGVVWVVTKSSAGQGCYFVEAHKKP